MPCEYCRELVPLAGSVLAVHGHFAHGVQHLCFGSGLPACTSCG